MAVYRVAIKGEEILTNPRFNKGTAFTRKERTDLDITGRLPYSVNTLDQQCERAYRQLQDHEKPIRKNAFLQSLKAQNWVLYYSLISRHLKELIPIIYTPTEAEAISNYSTLFRRSEGLFLTYPCADSMEKDFLAQTTGRDIQLIVVSDAQAILGIGDQGVGGIGISTAKAVIYTLIGGMDPSKTLSVTLDVGTDNQNLLGDPLYVGWREKRVRGELYDKFVDSFVQLVRKHHPHCLLHFEDFGVDDALRLLDIYHDKHAVFNDDVQGTGAVTLATLLAAVGVTKTKLSEQRIIIYGAGTAGLGIAHQIRDGIVTLDNLPREEANKRFWLIDKYGLVRDKLRKEGKTRKAVDEFVRSEEEWEGAQEDEQGFVRLLEVVKRVKPTVLIGCSTHAGGFSEAVIKEMSAHVDRPIIFPLSNPSRLVEVHPKDANDWSGGKALIATGSPFEPVKSPNGKDYEIAECNNALIYPGLGFGAILTRSRTLSDKMLIAGTQALAYLSPALSDPDASLLPDFQDSRKANIAVAIAVAEEAFDEGLVDVEWKKEEVRERVLKGMWDAHYGEYVYDKDGES